MISINQINAFPNAKYQVQIKGKQKTTHEVTLSESDYLRLRAGEEEPEELIKRSFEFLLEREANTSILSAFDLTLIGSYFPEYERVIGAVDN